MNVSISIMILFSFFPYELSGEINPLRNTYIQQSLMLIPYSREGNSAPFKYDINLHQKSKANFVITNAILITSTVIVINPDARKKFKERWELITSPNHASPLNQGEFHFRTLTEERNQDTQADKGVHFLYHYLPVKPLSILCEYFIDGLPFVSEERRKQDDWVTEEAFYLSTLLVFAGGFFEEYIDGKEKDEGFSRLDFIANASGSVYAILKHKGFFDNVYFYWDFRSPPDDWEWHKWDYMPGFEFRAVIDLSSFIFKERRNNPDLFNWWSDNIAYIPDVTKFGTTSFHKE